MNSKSKFGPNRVSVSVVLGPRVATFNSEADTLSLRVTACCLAGPPSLGSGCSLFKVRFDFSCSLSRLRRCDSVLSFLFFNSCGLNSSSGTLGRLVGVIESRFQRLILTLFLIRVELLEIEARV